jgi:hypothetical protein
VTAFTDATAVRPLGAGRYAVAVDPVWSVGGIPNGGYVLALLLRAALDPDGPSAGHPHPMATSAHFLARATPGPAEVVVEPLRKGRSVTSLRATLVQDGTPRVAALVTAGLLTGGETQWSDEVVPAVAPVERCLASGPELPGGKMRVDLLEVVDLRLDPAHLGWMRGEPAGEMVQRGHARMRDGDAPDPLALAVFADALPPVPFALTGPGGWAPTVELTFLLRALPADGWVTTDVSGRLVREGWFDETADLYDSAGHLVAQSRQLAKVKLGPSRVG